MTATTGFRTAPDGTRLFTHHWACDDPRGAVVLAHGLGEHVGRYAHIAPMLVASGFDVRGTDMRGFGASEGARAYVESFETLLDDLGADVEAAGELGVPVILLGHSLGGLQSLIYATSGRPSPDMLVLSSPAIRNTLPKVQIVAARVLAKVVPKQTLKNPVDPTQLSRDRSVGERYTADPLVVQKSSFGFAVSAFAGLESVPLAIRTLTLPTLVTHGADDEIVAPSVSEPLADLANVTRVVYPEYRHEPHNEDGGTHAVATIVEWIDRQLA